MYSKPGDRVLDIFSGTGTAPLQACLDERIGLGNDISPEAFLLTSAKVNSPKPYEFLTYLQELRRRLKTGKVLDHESDDLYFGSDFLKEKLNLRLCYHRKTLVQLIGLRQLLLKDLDSASESRVRQARFCAALMLGILHGDRPESLSLPLDRSKSLTSNHIRKMQKAHPGMYVTRYKDVIGSIALKAAKAFKHAPPKVSGLAFQKDAAEFSIGEPVDLVITSPPYYNAHTYAYDNRHRLWFLGHDYRTVQRDMFQTSNQAGYSDYILTCLRNIQEMLSDNSACVLVIGDVEMTLKGERVTIEAGEQIANEWMDAKNTEMNVASIILDPIPLKSRRYIHVPITKGIKQERIVIFHKGNPKRHEMWIDWSTRPREEKGPDWSSLAV